ncbi:MAG: dTDP-4-dehydrorhamnose 3,5-epimerase [Chlorobi bacterium]|nr:dTDP-4-dehydrorhamnose 3,5-epimerase [Chlorobiota bacterium]
MKIEKTKFPGLLILKPAIYKDDRGYFFESYNFNTLKKEQLEFNFVQDNQAQSSYGVIRGLHYQLAPYAQTKLIRVLEGNILDVVVDIRKGSPTFSKWFSIELTHDNQLQLLIPKGFAHGYSVLSKSATILYKCDEFYTKESERGINYNDNFLNIEWKIPKIDLVVSAKDKVLPVFKMAEMNFLFNQ